MKNITEIQAAKDDNAIIRLAPYIRVSSGSDEQLHSFASQVRYYRQYVNDHPGNELVDIYADEAVTGTSMNKRDDFNRLIRDCKRGRIDRIITKSVSRFARNTKELLTVIRMLKEIGVSVFFEEQGIDTGKLSAEMILTFPGLAAQKESETISANMRWSYKKRMESGDFNCCRAAYGYKLVKGTLEINEAEADIVRRVFRLYLSGMGKQSIANLFNEEKIPKRYGNDQWHTFTVSYILNNERYIGNALLQKSYTTEVLPYRKLKNRGEKQQYLVENSNIPIISREIYEAAQKLQKEKRTEGHAKGEYTLSHMIRCPDCGGYFRRQIVRENAYWICASKASGRTKCRRLRIKETEAYEAFEHLSDKLSANRRVIIGWLIQQLQKLQERTGENQPKLASLNKQLADINAKNHVLAQLRSKGILNDAEYTAQSAVNDQKLTQLKSERRKMLEEDENDALLDTLKNLDEMISEYIPSDGFDEELFEQIVSGIKVTDDGGLQFELIGGIRLTEKLPEKVRCGI